MTELSDIGVETHKGFVNAWECDENDHLNIQFYWKRFSDSAKIFHLLEGEPEQVWHDRHVRYYSELRKGANTIVKTALCDDRNSLIHLLFDGSDGRLSATAIDTFASGFAANCESRYMSAIPDVAAPRSLQIEPLTSENTEDLLASGQGILSHRSSVPPSQCDNRGNLLDQFYISRFSDAASHLWDAIGLSRHWLMQQNYGGAAVEMKATRSMPVNADMMLEVVSWIFAANNKTLSFRHQVRDMVSRHVVYNGAATALLLDLDSRKAAPLPAEITRKFHQKIKQE